MGQGRSRNLSPPVPPAIKSKNSPHGTESRRTAAGKPIWVDRSPPGFRRRPTLTRAIDGRETGAVQKLGAPRRFRLTLLQFLRGETASGSVPMCQNLTRKRGQGRGACTPVTPFTMSFPPDARPGRALVLVKLRCLRPCTELPSGLTRGPPSTSKLSVWGSRSGPRVKPEGGLALDCVMRKKSDPHPASPSRGGGEGKETQDAAKTPSCPSP